MHTRYCTARISITMLKYNAFYLCNNIINYNNSTINKPTCTVILDKRQDKDGTPQDDPNWGSWKTIDLYGTSEKRTKKLYLFQDIRWVSAVALCSPTDYCDLERKKNLRDLHVLLCKMDTTAHKAQRCPTLAANG